jgi:deoxyribodipyrimidine photo-lyase
MSVSIVWFRQDLRIDDNPALLRAAARGAVIPVFIHAPGEEAPWAPGGAARWWQHHSLLALDESLRGLGSRLVIRSATDSLEALRALIRETGADCVYWNRRYEPAVIRRDSEIKNALREDGCRAESFNGALLFEPHEVATKTGGPYQVFSPFWRAISAREIPKPAAAPARIDAPANWPSSDGIQSLGLLPAIPWDAAFAAHWSPGEAGALRRLQRFAASAQSSYSGDRDLPAIDGTSRLSAALHHGELSPRRVWQVSMDAGASAGAAGFRRELGWREFSHHLLYHFPDTPLRPLRAHYAAFPWEPDAGLLRAWQKGFTGYPIVDAGMRQLWTTGWMHNRVRMIVASFLVKHLLQPWQEGAKWFWDTLVDADLAQNTMGWQWSAGCGADAAPYFRIFNPSLQGEKFDPDGKYIRTWCPELAKLPASCIHRPWEADPLILRGCGVTLGETYPAPLIEHSKGRERALAALAKLPKSSKA